MLKSHVRYVQMFMPSPARGCQITKTNSEISCVAERPGSRIKQFGEQLLLHLFHGVVRIDEFLFFGTKYLATTWVVIWTSKSQPFFVGLVSCLIDVFI